jgi:hypothetical protein
VGARGVDQEVVADRGVDDHARALLERLTQVLAGDDARRQRDVERLERLLGQPVLVRKQPAAEGAWASGAPRGEASGWCVQMACAPSFLPKTSLARVAYVACQSMRR